MIRANNGILIVALTMALGVHLNNKWLMAAAFAMAGLSYLVNLLDELDADVPATRGSLFVTAVGLGVVTHLYVVLLLF